MSNLIEAPYDGAPSETRNSGIVAALILLTLIGCGAGSGLAVYVSDYTEQEYQGRIRQQRSFAETLPFASSTRLQKLAPLVTNLAAPKSAWIRVQASILLQEEAEDEAGVIKKKIEDDFLSYIRTLTLNHLEGGIGLQHLREDLTERAKTRTRGQVSEVILESVVIQ